MDRRRYVPAPEGLETRALLAPTLNLNNLFGFQVNTNLNIPITSQQKTLRIERLPFYLEKILPGRFLPHAELDQIKYLILGIGVDVNLNSSDFPADLRDQATSLKAALGRPVSRSELAVTILRELGADYARISLGGFSTVADEWESHCSTIGRNVAIQVGDREIRGRAEALGEDGSLLIRTEHGHLEPIVGGDVTVVK